MGLPAIHSPGNTDDDTVLHLEGLLHDGHKSYLDKKVAVYREYVACEREDRNGDAAVALEIIDLILDQNPPDAIIKTILLAKKARILAEQRSGHAETEKAAAFLRDALTLQSFIDDIPRFSLDAISRECYADVKKSVNKAIAVFKSLDIQIPEPVFAKNVELHVNIEYSAEITKSEYSTDLLYHVLNYAENGDREAQGLLATYYFMGDGVEKDYLKGLYWLEKSYTSGTGRKLEICSEVLALMGKNYEVGGTVEKDINKALYWYELGVKENSSASMLLLGHLYKEGNTESPLEKDAEKAITLYKKAADLGNVLAEYFLGCAYYDIKHDFSTAAYWWKKASIHNELRSVSRLGALYRDGEGVPQDYARAVDLFRKSALFDDPHGMINLGRCYLEGTGVAQDYKEGYSWFVKAGETAGDPSAGAEACYWIGYCCYHGFGVVKSKIKAREWIEKSIQGDNEDALKFAEEHPDLNLGNVSGTISSTYQISGDYIQDNHGVIAKDDAIVSKSGVIPVADKPRFCPECGKPVDEDAKFCKYCGRKLI